VILVWDSLLAIAYMTLCIVVGVLKVSTRFWLTKNSAPTRSHGVHREAGERGPPRECK
jgi:hypothetical protein